MASKYTRQHYQDVAETLRDMRADGYDGPTLDELAQRFARAFAQDNDRFQKVRFMEAQRA